jgi:hypothetical protein
MAAFESLLLAVAVGIAFIVITTLLIIIVGIHQEERHWTLTQWDAPTSMAALARRVLGAHCDGRFEDLWAESVGHAPRDADTLTARR